MMALTQANPVLAQSAHGDRAVPTPRSTFGLLDLPVELRNAIYVSLIHGQPLRICPARHPLRYADDQQCLAYQESEEACFYIELLRCANRHFQHLIPPDKSSYSMKQPTRYSAKQMDHSLVTPDDVLNFMRCCRTICTELESMFWSTANFAMGISQFGSFYDNVLFAQNTWIRPVSFSSHFQASDCHTPRGRCYGQNQPQLPFECECCYCSRRLSSTVCGFTFHRMS